MWRRNEIIEYGIITVLTAEMILAVMGILTGKELFDYNPYNSFALQADSWRQGRLDLGRDYNWLELAIVGGKYYVSFPPFPSYILFPFTFFFGSNTPDFFILSLIDLISVIFLYKIAIKVGLSAKGAMLGTLFASVGSNMLFVMIDPSVWFFAQAMCFEAAVLTIYYALTGKGAAALFFWACSVGCRPMQIVYLPVLLVILYQKAKEKYPALSLWETAKKIWWWCIPAFCVAVSYMVLNYVRFGSIVEFGHNYLPEFTNSETGQFHVNYIGKNLRILFHMPEFTEEGKMIISNMGTLSMLIVNPIISVFLAETLFCVVKREKKLIAGLSGILLFSVVYMLIVAMHKTMGAWHFGNRYSNDILPWIYLGTVMIHKKYPRLMKYQVPFCAASAGLNMVGTVAVYNGWV